MTITTTTTDRLILAIDLGKYKSVAGRHHSTGCCAAARGIVYLAGGTRLD